MAYTISVRPTVNIDRLYALYIVKDDTTILADYAYGIIRVGRKESLVSIDEVIVKPIDKVITEEKRCKTKFYFPSSIASEWGRRGIDGIEINMPILHRDNFMKKEPRLDKFIVPAPYATEPINVKVNDEGIMIRIDNLYIPVPRNVVRK